MIEKEIFQNTQIHFNKLLEYGFTKDQSLYKYSKNIMDNTFRIDIEINQDGKVKGKIYDLSFQEEYTAFRSEEYRGSFVKQVREEFEKILKDIKNHCFTTKKFFYEQSNRMVKIIKETYGDDPEFEWEKFPRYAIFRNKETKKWYAILMNLDESKLDQNSTGEVEIMNVKLNPKEIEKLKKQDGFYPAYHMNKKNWITITLNDKVADEKIINLIHKSYVYAIEKKNHTEEMQECGK